MRKIILILLPVILFVFSCEDDTIGTGNSQGGKLLKSVDFSFGGYVGNYSKMYFEYDDESRVSKAIYTKTGRTPETNTEALFDMVYDNIIYEDGMISSTDFYNELDSTSYTINYKYSGENVTLSNSNIVGIVDSFTLSLNYQDGRLLKCTYNSVDPRNQFWTYFSLTEYTYIEDSIVKTETTYSGTTDTFYYHIDKTKKSPFNRFNILSQTDYDGNLKVFFLGSSLNIVGVYRSLEDLRSNDYTFQFQHDYDEDRDIIRTSFIDYSRSAYMTLYSFDYY
ncbi:MAG: hypothetical protein Kapaf2KO_04600 [Candidatus Kapaibacteriales bacterium]